jgi:hypothetical protein
MLLMLLYLPPDADFAWMSIIELSLQTSAIGYPQPKGLLQGVEVGVGFA